MGMKPHDKKTCLLFCLLVIGLQACSLPFGTAKDGFEVVDRAKPASAPWKYTRTPDLGLTATSQYLVTATQLAIEAQATQAAQGTATAEAFAIQSTATAAARESAITAYTYYDPFDENINGWRVGVEDNEYWQGSIAINDGVYSWQVASVKQGFFTWGEFKPRQDLGILTLPSVSAGCWANPTGLVTGSFSARQRVGLRAAFTFLPCAIMAITR
jgi:hypothetical protein